MQSFTFHSHPFDDSRAIPSIVFVLRWHHFYFNKNQFFKVIEYESLLWFLEYYVKIVCYVEALNRLNSDKFHTILALERALQM